MPSLPLSGTRGRNIGLALTMPSVFSSLISGLGSYVPKSFALASFIPTLTFVILNLAILLIVSPTTRDELSPRFATLTAGFYYGVLLVAIAIAAYILSTAVTYMREVLEGRHLWPHFLLQQKKAEQGSRAQRLEKARKFNLNARTALGEKKALWKQKLGIARDLGAKRHPKHATYMKDAPAYRLINTIRKRMSMRTEVTESTLGDAVFALRRVLYVNDSNAPGAEGERLQNDYRTLLAAFDYAATFYGKAEIQAFHERQFGFGGDIIAPTRVGNIAASMQSYADTRYGMDLDFFWGRIQVIAQNDAKYADVLINAKTQLDFLVTSYWLSATSTIAWIVMLALYGDSAVQFLVVATLGITLTFVSYELLSISYYAFADAVRVTIDLYRFDLLTRLHVGLPHSTVEERALWQRLARIAAYGQGELNMAYLLP
jgi:hypothetical protein